MTPPENPTVVLRIEFATPAGLEDWQETPIVLDEYADDFDFAAQVTEAYSEGREPLPATAGEILELMAGTDGWQVSVDGAAVEACADSESSPEASPGLLLPAAAMQLVVSAVRESGANAYGYLLNVTPEFDEYAVSTHLRSHRGDIVELAIGTEEEANAGEISEDVSEIWERLADAGALWPVSEDPTA